MVACGSIIAWVWSGALDSVLPGVEFHFPVALVGVVALSAVVLGVIAAILPARRAARMKPVEALSYE